MFLVDNCIKIVNTGPNSEIRIIYVLKRKGMVLY